VGSRRIRDQTNRSFKLPFVTSEGTSSRRPNSLAAASASPSATDATALARHDSWCADAREIRIVGVGTEILEGKHCDLAVVRPSAPQDRPKH